MNKVKILPITAFTPRRNKRSGYLYVYKQGGVFLSRRLRWVIFDGKTLRYYSTSKDQVSKRIVPLSCMTNVEMDVKLHVAQSYSPGLHLREVLQEPNDSRQFKFKLHCTNRVFLFASDSLDDCQIWSNTLMQAIINYDKPEGGEVPGGDMANPDIDAWIKINKNRYKFYVVLKAHKLCYYENIDDYKMASPLHEIDMELVSSVKEVDRTKLQLKTHYSTFMLHFESSSDASNWKMAIEEAVTDVSWDSSDAGFTFGPHDTYIFNQALKKGTEKDNYVRVNVVGYCNQGKTSLIRRLLHQSLEGIESTDGIEIQVKKCKLKEDKWETYQTENDIQDCLMRFVENAKAFKVDGQIGQQVDLDTEGLFEAYSFDNYVQSEETEIQPNKTEDHDLKTYDTNKTSTSATDERVSVPEVCKIDVDDNSDPLNQTGFVASYSRQLKEKSRVINENCLTANIWDFGGQYIYYATHQIFHSREAIYLLVFDLTTDLNEVIIDSDFPIRKEKTKNCLNFWINSIHAFVGPDDENNETQQSPQMQHEVEPIVILVGTHKDEFDGDTDAKFDEVIDLFVGTKARNHIYHRYFAVSNVHDSDEQLDALRNTISHIGQKQAERRKVPMKWIPLEIALLELKEKNIITVEEVKKLNAAKNSLVGEEEIQTFLKYHHLKGTLIYFAEEQLDKFVVVSPQYLTDAFRCIVTSQKFCKWKTGRLHSLWNDMQGTAILEKELLDAVWSNEPEKKFNSNAEVLLMFLHRHRILSELLVMDKTGNVQYQGKYMIPSLLKQSCEKSTRRRFLGRKSRTRVSLGLQIKNNAVLANLFHRVTAAALGKWPPVVFDNQTLVFQDVGVYRLDLNHVGQVAFTAERGIELTVINQCPELEVEEKVCDHLRRYVESVIKSEFLKLNSSRKHPTLYIYYLSCNNLEHDGTGSQSIYIMDEVKDKHRVCCPDNADHSIECKKAADEWFHCGEVTEDEIHNRRVTSQDLVKIADCLGYNWEMLGVMLDVRVVETSRMQMDHPKQTATCIWHMLQTWEQEKQENATLLELISAMKHCKSLEVDWDGIRNILDGH